MKRLFFFLLMMVSLTIKAQETYSNFLEDGKVWKYHYYNYFTSLEYDFSLFVSGDTLINGRQYKKICRDTADKVECALRQEGQQIYMANESGEKIVYDFSLNIGNLYQNDEACVSAIDTIKVGSRLFRRFRFSELPSESRTDYWIEGVGGTGYLLNQLWTVGPSITFLSCEVNGETILRLDDIFAQEYYPEGTKWTEIRLDTLKYDSWYSLEGNEWVPNFETIDYYVKGEYTTKYGEKYKCVYTNGPAWTDSLTLGIQEGGLIQYNEEDEVIVTAFGYYDYGSYGPLGWAPIYQFDWSVGKGIYFKDLLMSLTTYIVQYECYYGIIDEIKEDYFGGARPLKYVDLDGKAPECGKYDNPQKVNTQGGRIIQGIGITEWNDGECLFGPPNPYRALGGENQRRHYRSMLVHFERNGEVLYDVWPEKGLIDGIKSVSKVNTSTGRTLFDLQGRRIQGQPHKGMYIQGGKKYVK